MYSDCSAADNGEDLDRDLVPGCATLMSSLPTIRALCRLLALLLALASLASAAPPPAAAGQRAIWLWDSSVASRPATVVNALRRERVGTVFLFAAPRSLRRHPQRFSDFLARAHAAGMVVHALNGEPQWVMPVGEADAQDFFAAIAAFNAAAPPDRRFDAIHLDVEPYTLDTWGAPSDSELPQRYLDFLRWTRAEARKLGLPLALDVPMLFQDVTIENATLMAHALSLADQVAIMSYEPGGDHVVERTAKLLRAPASGTARVWIGISADPRHTGTTSRAAGRRRVENDCRSVEALARREPRVLGAAIHDYEYYSALLPRPARAGAPPLSRPVLAGESEISVTR